MISAYSISQFKEVTGTQSDDYARNTLNLCDGRIADAIVLHFATDSPPVEQKAVAQDNSREAKFDKGNLDVEDSKKFKASLHFYQDGHLFESKIAEIKAGDSIQTAISNITETTPTLLGLEPSMIMNENVESVNSEAEVVKDQTYFVHMQPMNGNKVNDYFDDLNTVGYENYGDESSINDVEEHGLSFVTAIEEDPGKELTVTVTASGDGEKLDKKKKGRTGVFGSIARFIKRLYK